MSRICATPTCKAVIPAQKGRQRPRKYCEDCRPPRNRPNPRLIKPSSEQPVEIPRTPPSLVETYRRALDEAGRADTPEGVHALVLAEMLVAGNQTSSAVASLSRELRAVMDAALAGAAKAADSLDELADRRRLKASGA